MVSSLMEAVGGNFKSSRAWLKGFMTAVWLGALFLTGFAGEVPLERRSADVLEWILPVMLSLVALLLPLPRSLPRERTSATQTLLRIVVFLSLVPCVFF